MNPDSYQRLNRWFADYVSRFYTEDTAYNAVIATKIDHTHRVCEETAYLCNALDLPQPARRMAEIAALFHDLGRFKQYQKYRTFSDGDSENHARLSIREMGCHKVLADFSTEEKRVIAFAIAHHNALRLPDAGNGRKLFHLKLLRDADKLDIWRLVSGYLQECRRNPNTPKRKDITIHISTTPGCSPVVIEAFKAKRSVHFKDVKTFDDYKLLAIGWVYDLNFIPSFERLQKKQYIETFAQALPQTEEIQSEVERLKDDVAQMIRRGSRCGENPCSASDLNR